MQETTGEEQRPNRPRKGLGRSAYSDRPRGFLARFNAPFALGVRLFIASTVVGRHIEKIILQTPFTRKPSPQDDGESWMSSSQGSTPAVGRKQEEDSKPLAKGCSQASSLPSSSTMFVLWSLHHPYVLQSM
jgi:hypothetical protein